MRPPEQRCTFTKRYSGGDTRYPCSLERGHGGPHEDGYGSREHQDRWSEDYQHAAECRLEELEAFVEANPEIYAAWLKKRK